MQLRYTKASTKVIFFPHQFPQAFTLTALSHLQHGRFAITLLTNTEVHWSTAGLTGLASRCVSVVANSLIKFQSRSFFESKVLPAYEMRWKANSMTCKNKSCEYDTKFQRTPTVKLTREWVRYAELWSEIELPKLLSENNGK